MDKHRHKIPVTFVFFMVIFKIFKKIETPPPFMDKRRISTRGAKWREMK